jgi:hypothetical protein
LEEKIFMDKIMFKTIFGKSIPVTFRKSTYLDYNNLYIGLVSWEDGYPEPWGDLTVNLGIPLEPNCSFIDTNNCGDGVIDWLIENNIGIPTGRAARSGFCIYPEIQFNKEFLENIEEI